MREEEHACVRFAFTLGRDSTKRGNDRGGRKRREESFVVSEITFS